MPTPQKPLTAAALPLATSPSGTAPHAPSSLERLTPALVPSSLVSIVPALLLKRHTPRVFDTARPLLSATVHTTSSPTLTALSMRSLIVFGPEVNSHRMVNSIASPPEVTTCFQTECAALTAVEDR